MPDMIQAPFRSDSEIRLFILYLLDAIGEKLDFVDLHDIVVQNGLVKSFDFCLALPELVKSGHIEVTHEGSSGEEYYAITTLGHETVETLQDSMLFLTRERTLQNARLLLSMKKTRSDFRCSVEQLPDGRFRFSVRYLRELEEVLTVSAICDNAAEAERMQLNFQLRPDSFYRALRSVLNNRCSYFGQDFSPQAEI